jgi:hypothetical protein
MKKNILALVGVLYFMMACETSPLIKSDISKIRPDREFEVIQSEYSYKNLKLNDLDQMMEIMYEKNKEYKSLDQIQKLKEGAIIAFSRPNEDRTLDKIISIVRNPLEDSDEWENTIEAMVQQSLVTLKSETETPSRQATAGVILENIIADFKPLYTKQYQSGGFETEIIEKIAASQANYSKSAVSERRLNLMRNNGSPSEIAIKLIQIKNDTLKKEKK